jgi:predicted nucleic acid-binding protein
MRALLDTSFFVATESGRPLGEIDQVTRTEVSVVSVNEDLARPAAALRTLVRARRIPSAVDAIVVATADQAGGGIVLSGDAGDLRALARHVRNPVRIEPI